MNFMARTAGFSCDKCGKFETAEDDSKARLPLGWIRVTVETNTGSLSDGWDLCSSKCMLTLARERVAAEKEIGDPPSEAKQQAGRNANMVRWHREGKHDDDPMPECPECEAATA